MNRFLLALLLTLVFNTAYAAESSSSPGSASGESISDTAAARSSVFDDLHFSLFSTFHGPGVNQLDQPNALNEKGLLGKTRMNFDSELDASYMISKNVGAGLVIPFIYTPAVGHDMTLGDLGIRTFDKAFVKQGNLTVYANLILQASTSDYSRSRDQQFAIKSTPNFRYYFSDSRFAVGTWGELKEYVGVTKGKAFKAYAAPYVNYQLTPKLSANLEFEIEGDHMVGTTPLDFTLYQTDICPGFVYMISPSVMVNPYLQVFTMDKVAMNRTAVGAVISASL